MSLVTEKLELYLRMSLDILKMGINMANRSKSTGGLFVRSYDPLNEKDFQDPKIKRGFEIAKNY
jgi:hypothetical protein